MCFFVASRLCVCGHTTRMEYNGGRKSFVCSGSGREDTLDCGEIITLRSVEACRLSGGVSFIDVESCEPVRAESCEPVRADWWNWLMLWLPDDPDECVAKVRSEGLDGLELVHEIFCGQIAVFSAFGGMDGGDCVSSELKIDGPGLAVLDTPGGPGGWLSVCLFITGVVGGSGWSSSVGRPNLAVKMKVEPLPGTAVPSI